MARRLESKLRSGLTMQSYYPDAAKAVFTPSEALAEYNRLRKIANRRLEALQRRYPGSSLAREYKGGFPAAGKEDSRRIYQRLYQAARFTELKLGSVTGMREYRRRSIETLHERGYDFVNERNFDRFTDFMEEVKTHDTYSSFSSEEVVELFEEAEESGADPQEIAQRFEEYLNEEGERNELQMPTKPKKRQTKKKPDARTQSQGRGRFIDRRRTNWRQRRRR